MNQPSLTDSGPLGAIKVINLAVSFLLELVALVAFGYWGFQVGPNLPVKILLAIGIPLVVAVLWGIFLAPRSTVKLSRPIGFGLRLMVFGLAALAFAAGGLGTLAGVFAVIVIINYGLIAIWKQ